VVAPVAGTVTAIGVRAGDAVAAQGPIVSLDTGVVASPITGRVLEVRVHAGQVIAAGTVVARLEPAGPLTAVGYVGPLVGKSVRPGMPVELLPWHLKAEDAGYLLGTVRAVSPFPATHEAMLARLRARELVERFAAGGPPYEVVIDLLPATDGAPRWSSPRRPPPVDSGTLCSVRIVVRTGRPIDLVIPPRGRLVIPTRAGRP
jgi:hypothetical protein